MSDEFVIEDAPDVIERRGEQIEKVTSPYQGRLTVNHVKAAIRERDPFVRAAQRCAAEARAAEKKWRRLLDRRDDAIKDLLLQGWSSRAVEEITGVSHHHVTRIDKGMRAQPSSSSRQPRGAR